MRRFEPPKSRKNLVSLCCGLCLLATTTVVLAQVPAAMEPISAEPIGERESAPALNVTGSGSNEGYWSEEDAQFDSAFTKSLGDPQAWACNGQEYDLATPNYGATSDGEGAGRAIGFQADTDFKLNAVSIMGDLTKQSFDVVIYSSTDGHTAGGVLATFSATVGGTGLDWNTVPVAFDFVEGNFYFVNWRPSASGNWATSIDYYLDTGLPFSVGPLTILEGVSGANAEESNTYHPHFKFLTGADCNCQDNDLATPSFHSTGGFVGSGRAMGFRADRDFRLNAVSIKGDLLELPYEVVIYDSPDGHSAGSVLATFSATAGGTGYDWNVVPVSYHFTRFQYYVVNWRPANPSFSWANEIDYYNDSGLPSTRGPVTIVEGYSGTNPDPSNTLHPHFSFCISGDCTVAILGNPGDRLWNNDVKEKLLDTGLFGQVDVINISTETPTLAELQSYASVLVYTDAFQFENSVALGDNLADYVDGGGGVVTAVFADSSNPFGGRFNTDNYWAIPPVGGVIGSASLGAVWSPTHPIFDGVATFSGGTSSYRPDTFAVDAAATRVADWTDGRPLVATRKIGSARRVDLGFYPPSSDARDDFWNAGTDGALLMANALDWVSTCVDCDLENFSNPLAQWQNRWLFLNSNIENYYTAVGANCDPGFRGNQRDGIWLSDNPGCGNEVYQSPVRIDFANDYGDEASSFSLDQFTCVSGVTFNIYDKDGALVVTEPLTPDCENWSHFSWPLPNGISAFEYSYTGYDVEGNTSIDNAKLCFPLFRDGFESGDGSAWSASSTLP